MTLEFCIISNRIYYGQPKLLTLSNRILFHCLWAQRSLYYRIITWFRTSLHWWNKPEAWWHCALCRVSQPSLRQRMLHDAIGQAKGRDSSSIVLLLSLVCAVCMWLFLFATVANFLIHSGFRQVKPSSHLMSSLGLTLTKLVSDHVNGGFLIHSSTFQIFPLHLFGVGAPSSFVELDNLRQPSKGPICRVFWLIRSFYMLAS